MRLSHKNSSYNSLEGKDHFEAYLECFPDSPSLVLVRSVELRNFPREYLRRPVLDLCCGDGFFSRCLGLNEIYGCDLDEAALCKARATGRYVEARVCDATELLLYKDGSFQTVISNCALEHVSGVDQALAHIARVLRRGGCLIMSVPSENLNKWYLPKIVSEKVGLVGYGQHLLATYHKRQAHVNILSLECWTNKLWQSRLTVEKCFFLFDEGSCKIVTLLDSFGGRVLSRFHSVFKMITPLDLRKSLWRRSLKPIYMKSKAIDSGGEIVIVAVKS